MIKKIKNANEILLFVIYEGLEPLLEELDVVYLVVDQPLQPIYLVETTLINEGSDVLHVADDDDDDDSTKTVFEVT
jgi:hypothetical protein